MSFLINGEPCIYYPNMQHAGQRRKNVILRNEVTELSQDQSQDKGKTCFVRGRNDNIWARNKKGIYLKEDV